MEPVKVLALSVPPLPEKSLLVVAPTSQVAQVQPTRLSDGGRA